MPYSTLIFFCCLYFSAIQLYSKTPLEKDSSPASRLLETQKEYEEAVKTGDPEKIAEVTYLLGKRFTTLGNYSKAQQWLLKSLNLRKPIGASENIGKVYLRMCEIQLIQNDAHKAVNYSKLAIENFLHSASEKGLMSGYRAVGDSYQRSWKNTENNKKERERYLDSALFFHYKSIEIAKRLALTMDEALGYQSLSRSLISKGDLIRSLDYKQKALRIYQKENMPGSIIEISTEIAMELLRQQRADSSKIWLDNAKWETVKWNGASHDLLLSLNEAYAVYYEQTGNWRQALYYQKQARELKRKQFDQYLGEAIQNSHLVYENEIKANLITSQQKENLLSKQNLKTQNKLTIAVLILFLGAGLASFLFYFLFVKYRKISVQNAILIQEQSHRTKNNLQSVTNLLSLQLYRLSDPIAVRAMEESLLRVEAITMVHSSLYQGNNLMDVNMSHYIPDLVSSVLRTYAANETRLYYEIDNLWLDADKAISIGLIVNELTTNACKYALKDNKHPSLSITLHFKSGKLILSFRDNGPGMEVPGNSNSFGLKLISLLIDKLRAEGKFTRNKGCCFELSFQTATAQPINNPESSTYQFVKHS